MGRNTRWLIFIPVALFAIYAKPVKANVLGDWEYSQSAACGGSVEVIDNTIILHGPDQNGCSGAAHWVKIETTIPADVDTIDFSWSYQTNDGWVYDPPQYGINGVYTLITQQNNASGTKSIAVTEGDIFTFRQYSIDTCCAPGHLSISSLSLWEFTTTSTSSTTTSTTTVPMETVPVTDPVGTTLPETTTSSVPTTSLPQSEPTMPEPSSTTTTTTTSTVVSTTTTTEPVSPPPAQPPATVEQPPTTEPAPPDTEPSPPETEPVEETIPLDPPDTEPEAPNTTDSPPDTLPFVEDTEPAPPDTEPAPPETLPDAPEAPLSDETIETLLTDTVTVEALTEALDELTPEQAEQLIEAILEEEPTQEQATVIASSPAALAVLTSDQATQVFEALDVTELDNTQLEALAEAVTDAPTEVKEAFEDSVDIFSEGLGTYVPVDSKIPVSERQTLIAIAAGATLTAASTRMRR
jgi:hypothetical protein